MISCSARTAAFNLGVAPTDASLTKLIIDQMKRVYCNGKQAHSTSFIIGDGLSLSLLTAWTVAHSSENIKFKYYSQADGDEAKRLLTTYNIDFGVVSDRLADTWYTQMPDVVMMPLAAYAVVPGTDSATSNILADPL